MGATGALRVTPFRRSGTLPPFGSRAAGAAGVARRTANVVFDQDESRVRVACGRVPLPRVVLTGTVARSASNACAVARGCSHGGDDGGHRMVQPPSRMACTHANVGSPFDTLSRNARLELCAGAPWLRPRRRWCGRSPDRWPARMEVRASPGDWICNCREREPKRAAAPAAARRARVAAVRCAVTRDPNSHPGILGRSLARVLGLFAPIGTMDVSGASFSCSRLRVAVGLAAMCVGDFQRTAEAPPKALTNTGRCAALAVAVALVTSLIGSLPDRLPCSRNRQPLVAAANITVSGSAALSALTWPRLRHHDFSCRPLSGVPSGGRSPVARMGDHSVRDGEFDDGDRPARIRQPAARCGADEEPGGCRPRIGGKLPLPMSS